MATAETQQGRGPEQIGVPDFPPKLGAELPEDCRGASGSPPETTTRTRWRNGGCRARGGAPLAGEELLDGVAGGERDRARVRLVRLDEHATGSVAPLRPKGAA